MTNFTQPTIPTNSQINLLCLCADWCGSCRDYQQVVQQAQQRWPQLNVGWVDIEDHADLLDDLDIDTFPSILIYQADLQQRPIKQLFFGAIMPQPQTLQRLIYSQLKQLEQPEPAAKSAPIASELTQLCQHISQFGLADFQSPKVAFLAKSMA